MSDNAFTGQVMLAPMEGVVDHAVREILSALGGLDLCVTEFVRVVNVLLPPKVFYRFCPELHQGGKTRAGVPVRVQLLGQEPQALADNAARAVELGSPGIDLNFGCPAKTVNNSKGGAVLLKEPELLYQIVHAVRAAVPADQVVTAKMRLGYDDAGLARENAQALAAGGASSIVVHARTKVDGYRPPAYWDQIAPLHDAVAIPIIANGEIWNRDDALRCQRESGCRDIMVGRGALALPNLAATIRGLAPAMSWYEALEMLYCYAECEIGGPKNDYIPSRIKQWFAYLRLYYPQADNVFVDLRVEKQTSGILAALRRALAACDPA